MTAASGRGAACGPATEDAKQSEQQGHFAPAVHSVLHARLQTRRFAGGFAVNMAVYADILLFRQYADRVNRLVALEDFQMQVVCFRRLSDGRVAHRANGIPGFDVVPLGDCGDF